jgi:clan AA aspartic protease (TIGR02281 family)
MRKLFLLVTLIYVSVVAFPQVTIQMKREGGISIIPCKVNGLNLKFIFDTGASEVSISMTEATFMLKNDYLSEDDIVGKSNYLDANGNINVGVKIILREIEIGGLKLYNVKASVINNMKAPLLLGQSAIGKLGTIQLDLNANTLTILNTTGHTDASLTTLDTTALKTAIEETQKYADLYKQASDYYDQGNYQQAITTANEIINDQPDDKEALFLRAVSQDMLQDYKSAIADYSKLIVLDPKDHIAYCYRGKSKYDLKDYAGALADLNRGLLINYKYTIGIRWRAETKKKLNNLAGAMQDYNKAILLSPKDSSLYVDRAFLKEDIKDYTGAVIDCNKALSINSDYAYGYYCRGAAKRGLKQYSGAIEDLNKAVNIDPELPNAYAVRGNIKEDVYEDFDGAMEDYNKALELDPNYLYALLAKELLEKKIKENVWILIGSSTKDDKWYMYNSPVSKEYSTIKLWVKADMKSLTATKNGRSVTYTDGNSLMLCLFNCTEKEFKILSFKNYDSKGNLISEYEDGEYEAWKAITPGTVMETVFNKACEKYNN